MRSTLMATACFLGIAVAAGPASAIECEGHYQIQATATGLQHPIVRTAIWPSWHANMVCASVREASAPTLPRRSAHAAWSAMTTACVAHASKIAYSSPVSFGDGHLDRHESTSRSDVIASGREDMVSDEASRVPAITGDNVAPLRKGSHMPELTSGVLIAVMTVTSIVIFGVVLFFAMMYWQRRGRGADERSDRAAASSLRSSRAR
jgi:hypothetical protein